MAVKKPASKTPKKGATEKKKAAKTGARKKTAAQASTQAKAGQSSQKYDQPGAPWWKKIPLPLPK
ncbi:MAG: hypothetical protein KatS3mg077_0802 [Candidatus Binatia bacterium]|nr:MAG: hypothetical protein KatS3mg077_0802 [Candidatus Binatia bacterium]